MKNYPSQFVWLGQRNYVHGISMTHGLIEALDEWVIDPVDHISAAYHRMLRSNGNYLLFSSKQELLAEKKDYFATFVVKSFNQKYYVGLEQNEELVSQRIEYDEERMIAPAVLDTDSHSAFLRCSDEFPRINLLVALTKKLHLAVLPREGFSQWYFAGYDLTWADFTAGQDGSRLTVEMKSTMNDIYTKSSVTLNDKTVGTVLFAREVIR